MGKVIVIKDTSRRLAVYACFYAAWAFAYPAGWLNDIARYLIKWAERLADPEGFRRRAKARQQLTSMLPADKKRVTINRGGGL